MVARKVKDSMVLEHKDSLALEHKANMVVAHKASLAVAHRASLVEVHRDSTVVEHRDSTAVEHKASLVSQLCAELNVTPSITLRHWQLLLKACKCIIRHHSIVLVLCGAVH